MAVNINNVYAVAVSDMANLVFPASFVAGYTGTTFGPGLTFVPGFAKFSTASIGGGGPVTVYDKTSKILLKRFRVSVPKIPGARAIYNPGSTNTFTLNGRTTDDVSTNLFQLTYRNLGEWITLNRTIESPDPTKDFYLKPASTSVRLDLRNLQPAYNSQDNYIQWELEISTPIFPIA